MTAYHFCVHTLGHRKLLGQSVGSSLRLSWAGRVAERCWRELVCRSAGIVVDTIVVTPDHIEGLLIFHARAARDLAQSLAMVIGMFKTAVSQRLGRSIWESGYDLQPLPDQASIERTRQRLASHSALPA